MLDILLGVGLFFPVISWITLGLTWWTFNSTGKSSSSIMFPVVGPLLLTGWVLAAGYSAWFIPLLWLIDPFTWMLPWLLRQFWRISRWTRIETWYGEQKTHSVNLSFYSTGYYVLDQNWKYPHGPYHVTHISEVGQYTVQGDDYDLHSTDGTHRRLCWAAVGSFTLIEHPRAGGSQLPYPLGEWTLSRNESK